MKTTKTTQENTVDFLLDALTSTQKREDFILAFWIHWVENVTIRTRDFQNVLASASVNKWFIASVRKEEAEFRTLAARYPDAPEEQLQKLYCECINKLFSYFPKALLDEAQKREVKPKPQHTKVAGKLIEFPIIEQN